MKIFTLCQPLGFMQTTIHHLHLSSCPSTQDLLIKNLKESNTKDFSPHLISTDTQTQGHGRKEKLWLHTPGSLAMSFTYPVRENITLTSLEIAVIVCQFFKSLNIDIFLKWPNDFIDHSFLKLGGIILKYTQNYFIIGLGLNLKKAPVITDSDISAGALEVKNSNLQTLSNNIYSFLLRSKLSDEQIVSAWNELCLHINKEVSITDDKKFSGLFLGVDDYGRALLEKNGQITKATNGSLRLI